MKSRKQQANPHFSLENGVVCEVLTRKVSANYIQNGCAHVHSAASGLRDPLAKRTMLALRDEKVPHYSWELDKTAKLISVSTSQERHKIISHLVSECGVTEKRHLRERLEVITEELLTNAIYHAYLSNNGNEKYQRSRAVLLSQSESVQLKYAKGKNGIFLSIQDKGGALDLTKIGRNLGRCYNDEAHQIDAKESGAGLGLYLVFELATHIKVVADAEKSTTISCWIADKSSFDPDYFSFNFYRKGEPK